MYVTSSIFDQYLKRQLHPSKMIGLLHCLSYVGMLLIQQSICCASDLNSPYPKVYQLYVYSKVHSNIIIIIIIIISSSSSLSSHHDYIMIVIISSLDLHPMMISSAFHHHHIIFIISSYQNLSISINSSSSHLDHHNIIIIS